MHRGKPSKGSASTARDQRSVTLLPLETLPPRVFPRGRLFWYTTFMTWALRRRALYISTVAIFAAVLTGVPVYYLFFTDNPTCSDGKENQDELGVDCGGGCARLCASQVRTPVILWSRAFKVTDGVYNAVAYVENSNFDAGVDSINYSFELFDEKNVTVARREGKTFLSTNGITPIFEGTIRTGMRTPVRTVFTFKSEPSWRKAENEPGYTVSGQRLAIKENGTPRVDATITNDTVVDIRNIQVIATIFDIEGNAIASSETLVPLLPARESRAMVFTWPTALPREGTRIEVVPRVPLAPEK